MSASNKFICENHHSFDVARNNNILSRYDVSKPALFLLPRSAYTYSRT